MKSERRPPSPDVIVLSDNEQPASPRVNGLTEEPPKETSTEALMVSSVPAPGSRLAVGPAGAPWPQPSFNPCSLDLVEKQSRRTRKDD